MNQRKKNTIKQTINLFALLFSSINAVNQMSTSKKGEVDNLRVFNIYSFSSSDFTIYTTQAQSDRKNEKNSYTHTEIKNDMKIKEQVNNQLIFVFMLFVLILEQNDHRHHEHDSLHVDDGIREEIYAIENIKISIIKIYKRVLFFL